VRVLPFSWDSPEAVAARESVMPALVDSSRPTYVLSGGGYTELFANWVTARTGGTVECRRPQQFVSVEILVCARR
jgi:hypothetical protein